jgi:hypothetical protein
MAKPPRRIEMRSKEAYTAFNNDNKVNAMASLSNVIERYEGVRRGSEEKTTAISLTSDQSIRSPFNRMDYDLYRPNEKLPKRFREVIHACRGAYLRLGIVRNVIDMMTDFATEDLKIVHPDKKVEAFFKVWMKKVKLKEAVEEFVRHLLIDGNVVLKRTTAKLSKPVENQWMEIATAAETPQKLYTEDQVSKREIPWKYNFLNVAALFWIGDEIDPDNKKLAFQPSQSLLKVIRTPNDFFQKSYVDRLPKSILDKVKTDDSAFIPLDMDSIYVAFNKKDSWEDWAPPFLYSILSEIHFRDKLRQAEISALDGVINVIRLWKLGDHKEGILPNQAAVDKLISILETNTGGGAIDLVWDSMIEMAPFYPPVAEILDPEKYSQVNRDILIGLGVPEVLVGGQGGNFSNSFIQLKTMVEKLNYVRGKVTDWLQGEIEMVCQAMDIKMLARAKFNEMNLEDENANRKLIVGLLDRGVISAEAVLEIYGEDFILEVERLKQQKDTFNKAGIKLKSPLDPPPQKPLAKPIGSKPGSIKKKSKTGQKGAGRPSGAKDTSVRKTRQAKIRTTATQLSVFALDAIDAIDKYVIPIYIESANVSNARKLTAEQKDELNQVRITVLASIKPSDSLLEESILDIAENSENYNKDVVIAINNAIAEFTSTRNCEPTLTQRKNLEAIAWASVYNIQE